MEGARGDRLSTGVPGLDQILGGGFTPGRAYLARGGSGVGKTLLGFHFMAAGVEAGDSCLFISLSQSESRLRQRAARMGFEMAPVRLLDLSPASTLFSEAQTYEVFTPAEVERGPVTRKIIEMVEEARPRRVVVDSVTQLRYLVKDPLQFRRQVIAFLQYLIEQDATVLFTAEVTPDLPDDQLQFIADGVMNLEQAGLRRTVAVAKNLDSGFQPGTHSLRITDHGLEVFPRLEADAPAARPAPEPMASGIPGLDAMLHGGLERGTCTFISGPSGSGKTTLGLSFLNEAAGRGERGALYLFDEDAETLLLRVERLGIDARALVERGLLLVTALEPFRYTPDEFAAMIRRDVEERNARVVMIDGLSGYLLSMVGDDAIKPFYTLAHYLNNRGVMTMVMTSVENITGEFRLTEAGISFMADNIVFLRYIEWAGEIHKTIGVLKKRFSSFEKALREMEITAEGVRVGEPLTGLHGILRGIPEWETPPRRRREGRRRRAG